MTFAVYIVLIFECLLFFSLGSVIKAGENTEVKPRIIDLIILFFMWAAAICSNVFLGWNKWLLVASWIALSTIIGVLVTLPRKLPAKTAPVRDASKPLSRNIFKRIWQRWGTFNTRLARFQTRIIFSLVFFILVSPIALVTIIFKDPLRIKNIISDKSQWLNRSMPQSSLDQFRKQS